MSLPARLNGHRVSGWVCASCGVVAKSGGVVPSFELERRRDGDIVPILRLAGEDGHAQVVTLGFDNLAVLIREALSCTVADPVRGRVILAEADDDAQRAWLLDQMRERLVDRP